MYPVEVIKTHQQVAPVNSAARRLGTLAYMMTLRREGGVRVLYRGFGWNVLGGAPSEVVYYVGYTHAKNVMLGSSAGQSRPSAVYLAAGALADMASVLLSVPVEVISQRLQVQSQLQVELQERQQAYLQIGNSSTDS